MNNSPLSGHAASRGCKHNSEKMERLSSIPADKLTDAHYREIDEILAHTSCPKCICGTVALRRKHLKSQMLTELRASLSPIFAQTLRIISSPFRRNKQEPAQQY